MLFEVEVRVRLKRGVADPEGENTRKALKLLGFNVRGVRTEKVFLVSLNSASEKDALREAEEMCKKLLANPVIQEYEIKIRGQQARGE
ncbi:MAG: phosphoribosylformylglycinamidine synthase subunit PurS [Candidatus Methanospirare jalkutatii]|nr:MAG: phosphoribosylformylglycinamidine synthase subunit PurS [Candidatus Methanospirare jalkutatii]UYZ40804.1 MAG: phosphoribosylformylglycinamidine synthase subunit PurS [Candidatus Methanospirare jalkutatii]